MTMVAELTCPECGIALEFLFWLASPPMLAAPRDAARCPHRKPGFNGEGERLEFTCVVADRLWDEAWAKRRDRQ